MLVDVKLCLVISVSEVLYLPHHFFKTFFFFLCSPYLMLVDVKLCLVISVSEVLYLPHHFVKTFFCFPLQSLSHVSRYKVVFSYLSF